MTSTNIVILPKEERFEIVTEKHFLVKSGYTQNIESLSKNIIIKGSDFSSARILLGEEAACWVEKSPRETGLYGLVTRGVPYASGK